ncbi:Rossmann-fold NAD(P)-binding domain-containing protein [Heracleum sosnowskyi]|uniref:Rossmann-fold NAD(P)-binding domain-containing protein n=1 Tax=Heracleum sosnowskyi TaxID=360622 RepID=A0AAD8MTR5_9APIA|nr:Rossmann-fold NAD(P)-binding domain-containing protein [Heracleum sosnowskyi]
MALIEVLHFVWSVEFWRMGVCWTLSLIMAYARLLAQRFFSRQSKSYARCSTMVDTMKNSAAKKPVCVITGATSGLGAAAAAELARNGFCVVLAGRSSHLLSKTISEIRLQNKAADLKAFHLDLSSFGSILKFKAALQQWLLDSDFHCSIQILINNAGILATSYRCTSEGYDQMMGTNYIGAFTLTKVLQPLLENSPIPSRIVNVSSFTHWNVSGIRVDKETVSGMSFSKLKCYPYSHIYEYSKLFLLLFSYELHRQFLIMQKPHQISVIAVDPGVVKTNIMQEIPSCLSETAFLVLRVLGLLQSPEVGVSSIVDAALSPPEVTGSYYFGGSGRTLKSSKLSYDKNLAKELWKTSCELFLDAERKF